MNMKRILIAVLLLVAGAAGAQSFFPMREGTVLEYKYYDAKGRALRNEWKSERWLRFTVEKVWGDSVANVVVENEAFARLAKNRVAQPVIAALSYGDVRADARGVVLDNMQWLFTGIPSEFNWLPDEELAGNEDFEENAPWGATVDGVQFLPRELHTGDSLPDERYSVLYSEQFDEKIVEKRKEHNARIEELMFAGYGEQWKAPTTMSITFGATMSERVVTGQQRVKTPAGEFECWAISYRVVGPSERFLGIPERFRDQDAPPIFNYVDYLSPDVGLVKREKLNYRGNKVEETMVLESVK
jgi:hypothetical protein